jgi:predicted AAA+ superfamily ATPase
VVVKNEDIFDMNKRYIYQCVKDDIQRKMVFIGGPRQVGKTHFSKDFAQELYPHFSYLNWDDAEDRMSILERSLPKSDLIIFDELHKNRKWRGLVKGLFDKFHPALKILVTGSARLDYYRFGGDSLQGRYHYFRLHPLTVRELGLTKVDEIDDLLKLSGFPEPYFSGSERSARRWSRSYRQRLIREDLSSLEKTEDLARVELMAMRLPELVGSPLSINALREDLEVSHATAKKWLQILERLYHVFTVTPFGSPRIKSVKKEFKHYHYDWSLVKNEGARFENFIGSHLLKWCHWLEDSEGIDIELRYFRDREQREVDFVVVQDGKPILFCEVKITDKTFSPHLFYLKQKFPDVRAVQVVRDLDQPRINDHGLELLSAISFLGELPV